MIRHPLLGPDFRGHRIGLIEVSKGDRTMIYNILITITEVYPKLVERLRRAMSAMKRANGTYLVQAISLALARSALDSPSHLSKG